MCVAITAVVIVGVAYHATVYVLPLCAGGARKNKDAEKKNGTTVPTTGYFP